MVLDQHIPADERDEQLGEADMSEHFWYRTQDGKATCATITGSMVGALGGCLVGIGILAIPGVAPLIAVGTSGTALAATIAGAGIGIVSGNLISALASLEIFSDRARVDSDRSSSGAYPLFKRRSLRAGFKV
jgi:hypothetical protein